ncbi:class I SAM-dependent RNA methyltransferase [Candidatus Saccharibacteria bacterium]|nr:MAG: class I SAM-dependent RNA methyltransferase [Candidatus Saccharibacteria bacterium]
MLEEVTITKLVHGGQGLGELADGRKVFVWNALPGEIVLVRITKNKRSYAEAVAEKVILASPDRIVPVEDTFLATSPWQIMTCKAENRAKIEIICDLFRHEKINCPLPNKTVARGSEYHYRNKMEYSFCGDKDGLHLALHERRSHGKQPVQGSALAMPAVDAAANVMLAELRRLQVRANDLKTLVIRCDQEGTAAASLFVKPSNFPRLKIPYQVEPSCAEDKPTGTPRGLRVYHSNPKSPTSVATKLLYELGDCELNDELLGKSFHYNVDSFFQVNVPVYEEALKSIRSHSIGDPVDMYAGVGTIGLSVAQKKVTLVEHDPVTATMARKNISCMIASGSVLDAEVVEAPTEKVLEYITGKETVIFDPPRAGLHPKVVERCLDVLPQQIIYLSCNPATQARDLAVLQEKYVISRIEVFNFFPRTPHIETLAVLTLNS